MSADSLEGGGILTILLLSAASAHLAADEAGAPQQQSQRQSHEADPAQHTGQQWLRHVLQLLGIDRVAVHPWNRYKSFWVEGKKKSRSRTCELNAFKVVKPTLNENFLSFMILQ